MKLPEINIAPIHTTFLKVLNKEIKFRPYTISHEKAILTAMESKKFADVLDNYAIILRDCLETEINIDELSIPDFTKLVIMLRAKSNEEIVHLQRRKCKGCGKPYDFDLDLEESIKYINETVTKKTIDVSENLGLELKPMNYNFLKVAENSLTRIDTILSTISYSISRVVYNGEIYTDFNPEEIKANVISNLSSTQIEKITNELKSFINLVLELKSICPFCKTEEVDIITDFLKYTL